MVYESDVKDNTTGKKNKPLATKVINKAFCHIVDSHGAKRLENKPGNNGSYA